MQDGKGTPDQTKNHKKNLPSRLTFKWNYGSSKVRNNSKKIADFTSKIPEIKITIFKERFEKTFLTIKKKRRN